MNSEQTSEVHFWPWDHALHYNLVAEWWEGHEMDPVPANLLPCHGAIVVDEDFEPRGSAWYIIDPVNQQAYLSWLVSNPENPLTRRLASALYQEIARLAAEQGAVRLHADR